MQWLTKVTTYKNPEIQLALKEETDHNYRSFKRQITDIFIPDTWHSSVILHSCDVAIEDICKTPPQADL